jgi:hypothetical protein
MTTKPHAIQNRLSKTSRTHRSLYPEKVSTDADGVLWCERQRFRPLAFSNISRVNNSLSARTLLFLFCRPLLLIDRGRYFRISRRLFEQAKMTIDDIDFVITSDQTHLVWQDQMRLLGVPESKSISCFHKYGNTVAAMVPLNLHEAITEGHLKRGMTVLIMGHGAGASGGGFIFNY